MQEAVSTLDNPPSISALELHEILIRSHASQNVGRKRFIDALRALHDSELYKQLGFPSIAAYGEATFRYSSSRTHEFIQVSRALLALPAITAAFEQGAISFHLAARLSEVATVETEGEWLAFLGGRRVRAVLHELRHAKETRRDRPRRGSFGLPGLPVKIAFTLSPEEHAIYEKALEKVRGEIAPALGGDRLEPSEVLLVLLRRVLETDTMTARRKETGLSPFTIVVHQCPECARGALETRDGRVELRSQVAGRPREGGAAGPVTPEGPLRKRRSDSDMDPTAGAGCRSRRGCRDRRGGRMDPPFRAWLS